MNNCKIYAFLTFLLPGSAIAYAQSMLDLAATKNAILKNSNGEIQIIDKASHNGIRHNAQSFGFIKDWFSKL